MQEPETGSEWCHNAISLSLSMQLVHVTPKPEKRRCYSTVNSANTLAVNEQHAKDYQAHCLHHYNAQDVTNATTPAWLGQLAVSKVATSPMYSQPSQISASEIATMQSRRPYFDISCYEKKVGMASGHRGGPYMLVCTTACTRPHAETCSTFIVPRVSLIATPNNMGRILLPRTCTNFQFQR